MKIGKIWRHWQSLIYLETKWKIFEESRSRQLFNTFYKTYLAFFIVEILKSLYYSVFMKFSTSVFRFEHFHLMLINWLWSGKPETRSILWVLIVCLVKKKLVISADVADLLCFVVSVVKGKSYLWAESLCLQKLFQLWIPCFSFFYN